MSDTPISAEEAGDVPELSTDLGGADAARQPIRRCLASGERLPVDRMVRFVLDPSGTVAPDLAGKLPGRGMWLSADAQSIKTAQEKRLFARAARAKVSVPEDLPGTIERLLVKRCIETLSLARRAGEAVCGFEKTRAALTGSKPGAALLVEARDGAADGRSKMIAAAGPEKPIVMLLDSTEIGAAFGRDATVHAAVTPGGLSRRFLMEASRLAGFRETPDGTGRSGGKDDR